LPPHESGVPVRRERKFFVPFPEFEQDVLELTPSYRFNYHVYLTELAGATRLFFVTVIGLGSFGNGFPVRNFGCL
jgi:hypothetical protein